MVEADGTTNTYTGLTGSTFKDRYDKHSSSFRNEEHSTTLSSHIWKLKDNNLKFELSWKIEDYRQKEEIQSIQQEVQPLFEREIEHNFPAIRSQPEQEI